MNRQQEFSKQHLKVTEANRLFYAKISGTYDQNETCVNDETDQKLLLGDLEKILSRLGPPGRKIRVLDALGGSGNVALKLLEKGLDVTVVDISPELLSVLRKRCQEKKYPAKLVCKDIVAFLAETSERYDLITFSSALHHLVDYQSVLKMALNRLEPRGLVYTIFDPTAKSFFPNLLIRWDYYVFKLSKYPFDVLPALWRKVKRRHVLDKEKVELAQDNFGILAEYHVESGIDDWALVQSLKEEGITVLAHDRYPRARHAFFEKCLKWFGSATMFKLLLTKESHDSSPDCFNARL